MLSNKAVVKAWVEGKRGASNRMMTDGETLWSYSLPIGVTVRGVKVALPAMAPNFVSQTTSVHSSLARQYAAGEAPPEAVAKLVDAWRSRFDLDITRVAREIAEAYLSGEHLPA